MIQKSFVKNDKGKLYLVPTPIGNMDDITLRGIKILKSVDYIYAEDTRVTLNLLSFFNIKKKVFSCHKYSEEKNKFSIIDKLNYGFDIAYVSDRGTPSISDPGEIIVKEAIKNNIDVISLPGANALLPALTVSGLSTDRFLFYGFLSSKKNERINELKELNSVIYTIIFYESPHRILDMLRDMLEIFGNRNISISREISKMFEEVYRGTIKDAFENYSNPKGEFVIVVEGNNTKEEIDYVDKVNELVNNGEKMSTAIKEIATIYGISKNKLYEMCKERLI